MLQVWMDSEGGGGDWGRGKVLEVCGGAIQSSVSMKGEGSIWVIEFLRSLFDVNLCIS